MKLNNHQKNDFIKKAAFIADKSSCLYKVGCVGVIEDVGQTIPSSALKDLSYRKKDGFIYLKSWNETLHGEIFCQECDDKGNKVCIRQVENLKGRDFQKVCSIHAESNLIAKFARYGISTEGMVLFITNTPCYVCAKNLIQAGVSKVYYLAEHTDTTGMDILRTNGIISEKISFN